MASQEQILDLKRKALACKREGDIEAAKSYLRQAKQLEQNAAAETNQEKSPSQVEKQQQEMPACRATVQQEDVTDDVVDQEEDDNDDAPRYEDPVNKAIDEANLEELDHKDVRFSDTELIDYEAMQDMREIMSEQFPTEAFYQERILANKRAALEKKQNNDIPAAKQRLVIAKQLEKAYTILFQTSQVDQEDDGEDYSLLDELFAADGAHSENDDGFFEQLFGKSATVLELDDLDDMDAALLKDMMDAGMQVPSVEEVMQSAEERKVAAVAFKKDGNLEAAKAALLESKRLTGKANQLSTLLRAIENGVSEELDPEVALGDLLKAGDEKKVQSKIKEEVSPTKRLLSSAEYREQAVKLKQLGNKDAAIAALRLYREALAEEEKAKVAAQKKEWIIELQKEAALAHEQARRFVYYTRFMDEKVGSAMTSAWRLYAESCSSHAKDLSLGVESASFRLGRRLEKNGLRSIADSEYNFLGKSCDPSECRIEVSILELIDLHNNKRLCEAVGAAPEKNSEGQELNLPNATSIRVVMIIHLPRSAEVADESEQILTFTANLLSNDTKKYIFGPSQYIHAERGTSRFAKLFARRLSRRRCVAIEVIYSQTIVTKGLFSTSSTTEEISLGSAAFELTALQEKNFIAMDLPLFEARREVGGKLRLAIRSGSPFGEASNVSTDGGQEESTDPGQSPNFLENYSQLVFF
ncbi:hypothetical protein FisN_23Hh157 [Fistulifera solaris]|uniref:Uncharacterized protein n=1 Tax=Fistulifera solaris TaxID=1519565 RepID=A0A1Z5KM36_FISSO|nr:hypothetical protein FisN_23Hh157 [Fistulifera solaris]|eukprot:GAX27384.1 hypothetical protein FisN_23Hh157 [Fistulifera solaris]